MKKKNTLEGLSVLIVDDDPNSSKLLSILLIAEGCIVKTVKDAEEALTINEKFKANLILLDLMLPGMNGIELSKIIKSDPKNKDVIIVIVTIRYAYGLEEVAKKLGCAGYIKKPIDTHTFIDTLINHVKEAKHA